MSRNSYKAIWDGSVILLNLGTAKTLNLFFSFIGRKVAETCGTILCWGDHVLAFCEILDISLSVFFLCFFLKYPLHI